MTSTSRTLVALGAAIVVVAGCYSGVGAPTPRAPIAGSDVPQVDASIEVVSASTPSAAAAAALDACGITNFNPDQPGRVSANFGIGVVSGMGLVVPGRNANNYAPLGSAPEIQTDKPLWVITTGDAWLSFPLVAGELQHATCVVPDEPGAVPTWFATGNVRNGDVIVTPPPFDQPSLRLPELGK